MYKILIYVGCMCCWLASTGCGNPKADLSAQIISMEKQAEANTLEAEQYRGLLTLYVQYMQRYPEDPLAPIYLYRMAEVYYRATNWAEAARHLRLLMEKYPNSAVIEDAYLFVGNIYEERLYDQVRAEATYKQYLERFPEGKYRAKANVFFKTPEEKLNTRIGELENQLSQTPDNPQTMQILAFAYKNFVQYNPKSELVPKYCYLGGRLASRTNHFFLAAELWEKLLAEYPTYEGVPEALFLLGNMYEEQMELEWLSYIKSGNPFVGFASKYKDFQSADFIEEAKKIHQLLITKYPNSEFAGKAKDNLANSEKSANDVINSFQKPKQDSTKK